MMKKNKLIFLLFILSNFSAAGEEFEANIRVIDNCEESLKSLQPAEEDQYFQIHVDGGLNAEGAFLAVWIDDKPRYRGRVTANPSLGAGCSLIHYSNEQTISIRVRVASDKFPTIETKDYVFDKSKGKYIQFIYNPNFGSSISIEQTFEAPVYM